MATYRYRYTGKTTSDVFAPLTGVVPGGVLEPGAEIEVDEELSHPDLKLVDATPRKPKPGVTADKTEE
jgi:hypothetical protein